MDKTIVLRSIKTVTATSATSLMMGGSLAFTLRDTLMYLGVDKDSSAIPAVSITGLVVLTYMMSLTRGASLWAGLKKTEAAEYSQAGNDSNALTCLQTQPLAKVPHQNLGKKIGTAGLMNSAIYSFFAAFLAANSLLDFAHIHSTPATITVWLYIMISIVTVYYHFQLPKAITNSKTVADLLCPSAEIKAQENYAENRILFFKTVGITSFGTFAFGALAHFLVAHAQKVMPVLKHLSPVAQECISVPVSVLAVMMYWLGKSLESYQYFSKGAHFEGLVPIQQFPKNIQPIIRLHQGVGMTYLSLSTLAYFRVVLELFDQLGADTTLNSAHSAQFIFSGFIALSALVIEYVFTYQNSLVTVHNFFSSTRVNAHNSAQITNDLEAQLLEDQQQHVPVIT